LIAESVYEDNNKFFSNNEFDNALEAPTDLGNYDVPGILQLMEARMTFLAADAEFELSAPVITEWAVSDNTPDMGESFFINATTTNAQTIWLGKRHHSAAKFLRVPMMDDGAHNDGIAGDGNYGVQLTMTNDSLQYYLYAENEDAGMFSPVRAEHEFHVIYSSGLNLASEEFEMNVGAYPNPTNGPLHVPCSIGETSSIAVYDVLGKRVLKTQTNQSQATIDLSVLPSGLYVVAKNNQCQQIQLVREK